jgi:hypothetical protein
MIDPENVRDKMMIISMRISNFYIRYTLVKFEYNTRERENEEQKKRNLSLNELIKKIRFCLLLVVKRGNISHEIDMYTSIHHEQTLPRASIYCVCMLQLFVQM